MVMPEMALTGYIFDDLADIAPFLERAEAGEPTFDWVV
jgi:predicted amidohydrolase